MICFKDKTFCASTSCKNDCGRKMTEQLKREALSSKLPVCYALFCEEKKDENDVTVK